MICKTGRTDEQIGCSSGFRDRLFSSLRAMPLISREGRQAMVFGKVLFRWSFGPRNPDW